MFLKKAVIAGYLRKQIKKQALESKMLAIGV